MKKPYNQLSDFLNNSIEYANVNEGIFDGIKRVFGWGADTKPTAEQTTKAKGILGLFGALKASLSNEDDEITKAYKTAMEEEQRQLNTQYEELRSKSEKLEAAKITAKSKFKQRQRELKHKERVAAYDARLAQVKAFETRAKKINVIFTANETDSMLRTINEVGKDLQIGEDSPFKQMQNLAMQICVGPDGKVRSFDEIKELAKTDKDLAKHLADYDKIAQEHGQTLISSMKDQKAFSAAFDKFQKAADEERVAEEELQQANEKFEEYERNRKAVEAVNKSRAELNNAKQGVADAQKAVDACKTSNPFVVLNNDGEPTTKSNDDIKEAFKIKNTDFDKYIKTEETDDNSVRKFDVDKYIEDLKNNGVPEDVANKIKDNLNAQTINPTDVAAINGVIASALNGRKKSDNSGEIDPNTVITAEDLSKTAESAGKKAKENFSTLQAKLAEAQTKLNNTPDPLDDAAIADDPNDDEETRKKKEELRKFKQDYDNIPENIEIAEGVSVNKDEAYDTTKEAGKNYSAQIEQLKNSAETQRKKIDAGRAARAESRKHALASINEQQSLNLSPEEEEQIANKAEGLQAGESFDENGNVGYYKVDPKNPNKKEFVRRKENMTSEEENQYIKDRDTNTLFVDPKINSAANVKVKKEDGKWYMIDGDDKTEISSDEAIAALANRRIAEQSEATIIKKKQDFAATIKKVVGSDGKVNAAEYNKLTDEQKNQIKTVIKNPDMLDNAFKGIDLGGNNETLDDMKKHLSDVETSADDIDAIDNGRDDTDYNNNGNDTDWEDEKNDDEDNSGDDIETDEVEDVEDTNKTEDTDKDGNKLKKGSDGKWYKENDLNNDGSPKDNVTAVDHKATKKQNKILKNPAKEWHRKKNKATGKTTKSYYNGEKDKNGNAISISAKEFRERVKNYQAAKAKQSKKTNNTQTPTQTPLSDNNSIIDYTRLRDWLFEKLLN
jgi:hypothetical protein